MNATEAGVLCGNRAVHGTDRVYHASVSAVRECFGGASPAITVEPTKEPTKTKVDWNTIPVGKAGYGFYALPDAEGTVHFYRVQRPTEGKWAGHTFITEQASEGFHSIEPRPRAYALLTRIAEDPETAGVRYAAEINKCSRCGRTLTDTDSRARGLGPDCRRAGW